jgi:hypothetical protein
MDRRPAGLDATQNEEARELEEEDKQKPHDTLDGRTSMSCRRMDSDVFAFCFFGRFNGGEEPWPKTIESCVGRLLLAM